MSCTELIFSVMDFQWGASMRQSNRQDRYGTISEDDPERRSCRVHRHRKAHLYIAICTSYTTMFLYFSCYLQAQLPPTTARATVDLPFRRSPRWTLRDDRGKNARTGIRRPLQEPLADDATLTARV